MTDFAIRYGAHVRGALRDGRPVVALESTIIAHGLPHPDNLRVAREIEQTVRDNGAVPATIGVLGGELTVGLDDDQIEHLALAEGVAKLSVRDLALAAARHADGATTVAATSAVAAAAEIGVFATGGLGGVHRAANVTFDESADLTTLARTPIAVVCAGVKSILDVGATLERLETLGVAVAGYRTRRFPGFFVTDGGYDLDWELTSPAQVADVLRARNDQGASSGALIVANPLPPGEQLDPDLHERTLADGLARLDREKITGKAVTPFLLAHFHESTHGQSLAVNVRIILRNAALAAQIAAAGTAAPAPLGFAVPGVTPRVVVVGDLVTDVLVVHRGPIQPGSDTAASITVGGGGQAANTAAWLAAGGHPVTLIASVGDDPAGRERIAELVAYGVHCAVRAHAGTATGSVLVLAGPDDRTMITDRGAALLLDPADVRAAIAATDAAHLHLSGYPLLHTESRAAGRAALAAAAARGLTTSVDAASAAPLRLVGAERFLAWVRDTDLLLCNADEAEVLAGPGNPAEQAGRLTGYARNAVVKQGPGGATWAVRGGLVQSWRAERVPETDVTGAGDAFAAGVLGAWSCGAGPADALAAGCALGAAAVSRIGARP